MFDHYKMFTNNIEAQGNAIEQFAIYTPLKRVIKVIVVSQFLATHTTTNL